MNIYNFLTDKGKRRYARVYPIECLYLKKDKSHEILLRLVRKHASQPLIRPNQTDSLMHHLSRDPEFSFPEKVPSFNIMIGSTRPDPKCNLILGSTRSGPIVSQYPI
ncbi:unnamed protein product (mitochondrion) [Musa acuminata var. zebrina]